MNFLAHLYLSGPNPQIMVGNFIGDFVRGRDLEKQFGAGIAQGIELHRAIDEFTDKHPTVKESKARLWPTYRHYSSVIIDIFYDHFLAAGWNNYSREPLAFYATRAYQLIVNQDALLPEQVKRMLPYMMHSNWLLNYAQVEGIQRAMTGMSRRATFESKMDQSVGDLRKYYTEFESEFKSFFPEIQKFVEDWLQTQSANPNP